MISRMRIVIVWLFIFCLWSISYIAHATELLPFSHNQTVTVCETHNNLEISTPPKFTEPHCKITRLSLVDPQNKHLWFELKFAYPNSLSQIQQPYGLFVFAKSATSVYLNGELLGHNGQPAANKQERLGKMDTVFFVPEHLLRADDNRLVMRLSAQHSLIRLTHPVHFIGLGHFKAPQAYIQTYNWLGLILLGAFLVGSVYFLKLSVSNGKQTPYRIFLCLCLLATIQLCAEISRGYIQYDYIWHDVRLVMVTMCSFLFGLCVLFYTSSKVFAKSALHWFYSGLVVTLLVVLFVPGFDTKTTAAVFFPLLIGLIQLGIGWYKSKRTDYLIWLGVQVVITISIVISAAAFHEITYFMFIGFLLCYFFWQQASEYQQHLTKLQQEKEKIAKLEYILEQSSTTTSVQKIEVSIAGKLELIDVTSLAYCKAAGDYVELHLIDKTEKLYSGSLKQLETLLPKDFLRVHRSYVVNLQQVTSLSTKTSTEKANNMLQLKNLVEVPVSRRLVPSVRGSLKELS